MARKRNYRRRAASGFRRAGGILSGRTSKDVMSGLGSAWVGEKVAPAIGINKLIPSAILGYFTGGTIGLVTAVGAEFLMGGSLGALGTQQQSTPAGTIYN